MTYQAFMRALLRRRWLYHLLFWLAYYGAYCFFILYNTYQVRDPLFYLQVMLFFPFDIVMVYVNFYILIPRLLQRKKYAGYILCVFVSIIAAGFIEMLIKNLYAHFGSAIFAMSSAFTVANLTGAMASRFYLLGLTTAIKLGNDWIRDQQLQKEKENLYLQTELSFLKSQVNPHFFFNTLNNLYSLALHKSEQTPAVILQLSDLMSYMLYDSNSAKVALEKEVNYLHNYLDLEKLRFGQRLKVFFEIEGPIEETTIPPMILILFVENCFKHGFKDSIAAVELSILLAVKQGYLHFLVTNPLSPSDKEISNTGIGLKNVRRRLDLLFGDKYTLIINQTSESYSVALKMPV